MGGDAKRFERGRYGVVSDRGLNPRRPVNEDSYLILDDVGLFAVADGVGGQSGGEVASQMAVEILRHHFSRKVRGDPIRYLERVIAYVNGSLYESALGEDALSGMATTLALILLEPRHAIICHVGDSRVYRFASGKLYRETIDHTLEETEHLGGLSILEYTTRHVLTRALGIGGDVVPDVKKIGLEPKTTFLLCTDGVTRHVTDEELQDLLAHESDPQRVCDRIKELCYERGARDNFTAIVVQVESVPSRARQTMPSRFAKERVSEQLAERPRLEPAAIGHSVSESAGSWGVRFRAWGRTRGALLLLAALGAFLFFLAGMLVERSLRGRQTASPLSATEQAHGYLDRAIRSFQAGRYREAEQIIEAGIRLDPSNSLYHHWLGRVRFSAGQYRAAAESFARAAELGGLAENLLLAAAAWQAGGDADRARAFLHRYIEAASGERSSASQKIQSPGDGRESLTRDDRRNQGGR